MVSGPTSLSLTLTEFAKKYGIILEASAIYAHEQNGKAERMNKTLTDMARTTMIESCFPEALWAEALRTACHVRDRTVSRSPRSDKPITPFEAYYGRKPEVQHMRPFGCLAYVTRPHELRRKSLSQTAAYKAIMLGYTESAHQYRVWNIRAGYIQLVRDATFNERLFPAASIGAYKNIFPQKPLPEALLASINNNTSLDTVSKDPEIQPSLEPENKINIDRQQDANATAQNTDLLNEPENDFGRQSDTELLDHTEISDDRNEPENDFGLQSVELELDDSELTEQRIEPEQVHMHGHTLVDDDKNGRDKTRNLAPTCVNHGGPASEMITPPQVDSPSAPQNKLYEAPLDPKIRRQSVRLKTKPRRRWDTRLHFARTARAAKQNPGPGSESIELDLDPQSFQEAMASPFACEWAIAMEEELEALEKNKTWKEVSSLPPYKKALGNKWVYKKKLSPDNTIRYKARLVAKGYEQRYGIDFEETFAPVVNSRTVRVLIKNFRFRCGSFKFLGLLRFVSEICD